MCLRFAEADAPNPPGTCSLLVSAELCTTSNKGGALPSLLPVELVLSRLLHAVNVFTGAETKVEQVASSYTTTKIVHQTPRMLRRPGLGKIVLVFLRCRDAFWYLAHGVVRTLGFLDSRPDRVDSLEVLLELALDSSTKLPGVSHGLPDRTEHRVGEGAFSVALEHDGLRLAVSQRAFLRPSPAGSVVSIMGVERIDFTNVVTPHQARCTLPRKFESPSNNMHC